MEYTKDLILNVHYSEVPNRLNFKRKDRTSHFFKMLKGHKIIATSVIAACILMIIDGILVTNFIKILETL